MAMQGVKGPRVVLVPCPFQGHVNPMLQLGSVLHSMGFSITIVHTKFNSPDSSKHSQFNFQSIPDGLSDKDISSGNLVALILALNANCKESFKDCLIEMMEKQNPQNQMITCIIYDELMYFAEATANHLKLKSIILRTTSAATFISRLSLIRLKAEGYIPLQDHMLQETVPKLHFLRFKDLPISKIGTPASYLELIDNFSKTRTSSAIIWNTMNCIEELSLEQIQQHCQVPIFPIGPLHMFTPHFCGSLLNEDTSCIKWLDKQPPNSVLYVSLGSVASVDENEVAEIAWGLANSKQSFLWVVRPGSVEGSKWIELLPEGFKEAVGENGCIVKWAPQKEVLAHSAVGGFFSHCGWNSTLECICEGVPMICRPCFGDQRVNARFISHIWRIGLHLENKLERGEIERAVRKLMVDQQGDEWRQRTKDFKHMVERCIAEGGSSHNSLNKFASSLKTCHIHIYAVFPGLRELRPGRLIQLFTNLSVSTTTSVMLGFQRIRLPIYFRFQIYATGSSWVGSESQVKSARFTCDFPTLFF